MHFKISFLFLILISLSHQNFAEETLSENQKLTSLAQVWGLLKYYHQEVASGKYDWDQSLFEKIPLVTKAKTKEELSDAFLNWLEQIGPSKKCGSCKIKQDDFTKNLNHNWINNSQVFTRVLIEELDFISKNPYQGKKYYVTTEPVGKVKIINESKHKVELFPAEKYRLLGLFRYWNIINYFFPYKYLADKSWKNVLSEMISEYRSANNITEYRNAIERLITQIDDTHAWISFNEKSIEYLPVKLSHIEGKAIITSYFDELLAKSNDLLIGDIIENVNGEAMKGLLKAKLKITPGSNSSLKAKSAYNKIIHGNDPTIKLTITRNEKHLRKEVKRYAYDKFRKNFSSGKSFNLINDQVGYIDFSQLKSEDLSIIFELFKDTKAIIMDLRNYPRINYNHVTKYISTSRKEFAAVHSPDLNYPGLFKPRKSLTTGFKSKKIYRGKVVLLVGEETISRSEFITMALQTADNVITIGSQTAGADGDVVVFDYLGGYKTAFSGNRISYIDGTESQRTGIKIDIKVDRTIKGVLNNEDEIMEEALRFISKTNQ